MSKTEIVFNIINICITTIWLILSWKTLQEIKKDREEMYRPFLRIKLNHTPFLYSENEKEWIFLENIGARFAKNIKIQLKISEDILKDYKDKENKSTIEIPVNTPNRKVFIQKKYGDTLDILDPKEKYFLKDIERYTKNLIDICDLILKKKTELKNMVLFDIDISYQDVLNKNYNEKYKLKFMIRELFFLDEKGLSYSQVPLKLEI